MLQIVQPVAEQAAPDQRADGRSADDVGLDPRFLQRTEHTNMSPAPSDTAAEGQAELQSPDRRII